MSKTEEIPVFSPADLAAIRRAIVPRGPTQKRNRAMLSLLEVTGLRCGELCALPEDGVRPSEREPERVAHVHVPNVEGLCKTGFRVVPFLWRDGSGNLTQAARDLEAWRRVRYPGAYLFTTRTGGLVAPSAVRRFLSQYAERAGVERAHPHMYRSTYATNLAREGWTLADVQKALGHKNPSTTARYLHANVNRLEDLLTEGT